MRACGAVTWAECYAARLHRLQDLFAVDRGTDPVGARRFAVDSDQCQALASRPGGSWSDDADQLEPSICHRFRVFFFDCGDGLGTENSRQVAGGGGGQRHAGVCRHRRRRHEQTQSPRNRAGRDHRPDPECHPSCHHQTIMIQPL